MGLLDIRKGCIAMEDLAAGLGGPRASSAGRWGL